MVASAMLLIPRKGVFQNECHVNCQVSFRPACVALVFHSLGQPEFQIRYKRGLLTRRQGNPVSALIESGGEKVFRDSVRARVEWHAVLTAKHAVANSHFAATGAQVEADRQVRNRLR